MLSSTSNPNTIKLTEIHANLYKQHRTNKSKGYEFRHQQLLQLRKLMVKEEKVLIEALAKDLHRSTFEAAGLEITSLLTELDYAIAHLKEWMKPEYTPIPALFAPATSEIVPEPFGVCLIFGAFNYPIVLTLSPLIGAIAAGNSAVIKPSELSVATEQALVELIPRYLDSNFYQVVTGDIPVVTALLALRWDKIFFTGSTRVGRIIAKAAAEHLTPVSLELGGKSPTIIDQSVGDLELAAMRVMWGKNVNAGQTCIAPDYLFVHEKVYDRFLALLKKKNEDFYGKDPKQSKDFARIVTPGHFNRLKCLLEDSKDKVYYGGDTDEKEKYIQPTILTNVSKESKVMQEEIFGPLLPVFKYTNLDEVISYVLDGEKPLTMYIFARDKRVISRLEGEIASGSVVVNDCLFQFGNHFAPFGGVGHSGLGGYKGKFSFDCFSQKRSILRRDDHRILDVPIRYPPYTNFGLSFFKFAATKLPALPPMPSLFEIFVLLGIAAILYSAFSCGRY